MRKILVLLTCLQLTAGAGELELSLQKFSWDLFRPVARKAKNVCYSPLSVAVVFHLVGEGARGQTASQLWHALGRKEAAHQQFQTLLKKLEKGHDENWKMANALWAEPTYPFLESFKKTARTFYGARLENLSFSQPERAAQVINDWVAKATRNTIPELLSTSDLNPLTRLVVTNALYFQGDWVVPFQANKTQVKPFLGKPVKKVPTMHQVTELEYFETPAYELVVLPYRNSSLEAVFVVPKAVDGLAQVEARFKISRLFQDLKKSQPKMVALALPKFEVRTRVDLIPVFQELGVEDLFDRSRCNLKGLDGQGLLYISAAVHQAFVKVDEKGTEAAAATAAVASVRSLGPKAEREVKVDRPFLFLLVDRELQVPVFVGRVVSP